MARARVDRVWRARVARWFPRRPIVAAAAAYLLVGLVILGPAIRPGRTLVPADTLTAVTPYRVVAHGEHAHNPIVSDAAYQFFPWFAYFGDSMRHGSIPEWNPLILGGVPTDPSGFVSPDYPGFWSLRWLDAFDAYNLFVLVHLLIGALGIYVLCRVWGVSPLPAWTIGLLGYASGIWVHWSLHLVHLVGMVWTPWALAAMHLVVTRPSRRHVALIAGVAGLWWLGGNPQYAYFGSLAVGAYGVALLISRYRESPRAALLPALAAAAGLVLGAMLAAPTLLPTARTSSEILRSREPPQSTTETHLPTGELVRMVVPDATGNPALGVTYGSNDEFRMDSPFFGLSALLLAVGGLAAGGRRAGRLLLAAGVGVILLLAFTGPANRLLYALIPGYDRFRGSARWLSVLPAFALPLAAMGLESVLDGDRRARIATTTAGAGVAVWVALWWLRVHGDSRAPRVFLGHRAVFAIAVAATVVAGAWVASRTRRPAALIILAIVAVEIGLSTPRWYPSVVERTAYPKVPVATIAAARGGRVIRVGLQRSLVSTFSSDIPMVYRVADADGQAVLFPRDYDRFMRLIDDYGDYAKAANVVPDLASGNLLGSRLLDVLDVRTVIAESNVPIPAGYAAIDGSEPIVYAHDTLGPAFLVPSATPADEAGMWRSVAARGWDPRKTASVSGLNGPIHGGEGSVSGGQAAVDSERWTVEAPQGGFLRVSARFDSGWSATIDGHSTRVLRADGIFRGVVVPPGRHEVRFHYRNRAEHIGRLVGLGALVAIIALAISETKWRTTAANPTETTVG